MLAKALGEFPVSKLTIFAGAKREFVEELRCSEEFFEQFPLIQDQVPHRHNNGHLLEPFLK